MSGPAVIISPLLASQFMRTGKGAGTSKEPHSRAAVAWAFDSEYRERANARPYGQVSSRMPPARANISRCAQENHLAERM